ncbi:MAG: signal peptidase I [Ilumatobacter sp.]|nr:signal peptidase I [Ilumatobacter sp.]
MTTVSKRSAAGRRRRGPARTNAHFLPGDLRRRHDGAPKRPPPVEQPIRHGPVSASPAERPAMWRRALSGLFTALIVGATIYLWPAPLGGGTRFVIVSGDSMEPTYDYGDMVLTRERGDTEVGDTVVFEVPEGGANGMLVIHRVVLVDEEGYFITQGDNRSTPDRWQLTEDDIVGHSMLHIPYGGHVIWFLQLRTVLGVVIGAIVVILLWPRRGTVEPPVGESDFTEPPFPLVDDEPSEPPSSDVARLVVEPGWSDQVFDEATMEAANAWLDAELARSHRERSEADVTMLEPVASTDVWTEDGDVSSLALTGQLPATR